MRLFSYQFQETDDIQSVLGPRKIEIERRYQDTLSHKPMLAELLKDCQQSPPDYVLIRSATALSDDKKLLQQSLTVLWDCHVGVLALDPENAVSEVPTPLLIAPMTWEIDPAVLKVFPAVKRPEPSDWIQLGSQLEQTSQRQILKQGHRRNRHQGLPPPGQAPYGYRRGKTSYLIDRRAAPVVKGFYEHFLLYGCLRSAVRFLAKNYGKSISVSTGKRWLTHPVYRGHLCYQGADIISDAHPPLLPPLEAAQVDRLLRCNQRFATRSASASRSLAGLVQCQTCGSGMTVSQISKPQRQYLYLRPQNCQAHPKCSGLAYDKVLERTIAAICDRLPAAIAALNSSTPEQKQALLSRLEHQEAILAQIPSLLDNGILDEETAQLRTFNLKTELSQLRQQLASFPPVNLAETAKAIAIPEFWQDLSETERRFYLREFIRSINISRTETDWGLTLDFVFEPSVSESRVEP